MEIHSPESYRSGFNSEWHSNTESFSLLCTRLQQERGASMRILVISNFYPPHVIGGYEIGCRDIVEGLKSRGHAVSVLTSFYGVTRPEERGDVYRWLQTDMALRIHGSAAALPKIVWKESVNRRAFDRVCRALLPDVVYVWNPTHISLSIA